MDAVGLGRPGDFIGGKVYLPSADARDPSDPVQELLALTQSVCLQTCRLPGASKNRLTLDGDGSNAEWRR